MEKKFKKKRASSVVICDASADGDASSPAAVGLTRRESDAAVKPMVTKRRKSRVVKLMMDERATCSTQMLTSSAQLCQDVCTVENRCGGDDSVSAASHTNGWGPVRDYNAGDAIEFVSSSCLSRKIKGKRMKGELCGFNEGDGQLVENAQLSSSPQEVTRKIRTEGVENGDAKGGDVERTSQEESIVKRLEEDRVWQYVCKRAVYISPPVAARTPDDQSDWNPYRSERRSCWASDRRSVGDNLSVEKTSIVDLTFDGEVVKVTLTRESREVRKWIEQQSVRRFGLDLEWQPNRLKGGKENKVSLLQLSTESECLLVQMLYLDSIPDELVQLLKDPNRVFAGVGVLNDAKKLERDHGLVCKGEVELTTLAVAHFKDQELKNVGLKALAKKVLRFDICKSKRITMSNWARLHLSRSQVEYASLDAWVSLAIYSELDRASRLVTA